MTVLAFLPVPDEAKGLIAIPCITFHLGQIFVDAFLATRWGHSTESQLDVSARS
jgi:predicted Na+-dependent transporter